MLQRLSRLQLVLVGFAGALVASGALAVLVAGMTIAFGWYDVSASKLHGPVVSWVLHTTMIHSVRARAKYGSVPEQFTAKQIRQGFAEYDRFCAMCHGGPGLARQRWVNGLEPSPPYLIDAARRWSPAELHFIISHGVKMTGMPAWGLRLTPEQLASLVAFLEKLPDISPAQYFELRAEQKAHPAQ